MNGSVHQNGGRNSYRSVLFLLCRFLFAAGLLLLFFTALRVYPLSSALFGLFEAEARRKALRRLALLCLIPAICVILLNTEEKRLPRLICPVFLAAGAVPLLGMRAFSELGLTEAPGIFAGAVFLLVPAALGMLLSPFRGGKGARILSLLLGGVSAAVLLLLSFLPAAGHVLLTSAAYLLSAPVLPFLLWGFLRSSLSCGICGRRAAFCIALLSAILPAHVILRQFAYPASMLLCEIGLPLLTAVSVVFLLPPSLTAKWKTFLKPRKKDDFSSNKFA